MSLKTISSKTCAVIATASVIACGASFEAVYESNVRFEHCYRLDIDPSVAPSHRMHCWRSWVESYGAGQTRDRVDYARRRLRALEDGDISRPSLDVDGFTVASAAPTDTPAPIDVHAPPPPTMPAASVDANTVRRACVEACLNQLTECRANCANSPNGDAAKSPTPEPEGKPSGTKPNGGDSETPNKCTCQTDFQKCSERCAQ